MDFSGFTQLGLWTKPGQMPFLCIEPMNGIADYENSDKVLMHKPDVIRLQSGKAKKHIQKVYVE